MNARTNGLRALVLGFAVLVGGTMLPGQALAQSASGSTDVDINLPEILVLHYFSNVDVTISGTVLQTWLGATSDVGTEAGSGAVSGSTIQTDVDISNAASYGTTNDASSVPLTLLNAWAVRSLAPSLSSTQVAITLDDGTLSHAGGDSITVSSAGVRQSGGGAFGANTSFAPPGLVSPKLGDVQLTLDLTSATTSGDYLDGQFTLTVTNI